MSTHAQLQQGERSRFSGWRLLGLGFWQAWQMISMCTPTLLPATDRCPALGNTTLWILTSMALGYLVIVLASRRLSPFLARPSSLALAGGLTAAGTVIVPCALMFGDGTGGYFCFLAGTAALSVGNALLLIMWGELWSTLATGRVGRHLYASYTFAFILFFVAYSLPQTLAIAFTAALPLASVAVLADGKKEPRRVSAVVPLDVKSIPAGRIFACIIIVSAVYGLSQGMVNTFAEGDGLFIAKALLLAGCSIAAITLSMVVAPSSTEPLSLYRPVIPAMVAGMVLLLVMPAPYRFVGAGLIIAGIYCLDMFMMLVSTDVAFRARISAALSFGLAILCARTGTLLGSLMADAALRSPLWSPELRTDVFLLGILVLVCVGMLFFTQSDVQKLYATARERASDASLERNCSDITHMCCLTKREAEVLVLLARGRTVRYISDELSIAQGTVKHHVSSIYRKVGVFDRQGLLDAVERGGAGKASWKQPI